MTAAPSDPIQTHRPPHATVHRDRDRLMAIHHMVRDAQVERTKHEASAEDNRLLAKGAHRRVFKVKSDAEGNRKYRAIDRIGSTLQIQASVMTETSPHPHFVPRETNEPPEWYMRPSGAQRLQPFADQIQLRPDQMAGRAPIDDTTAQQLLMLPDPQGDGTAPLLTADDMVAVTDQLAAEALSQELTSQWTLAHGNEMARRYIYSMLTVGWRDLMFQWDGDEHRGSLLDLHPFDVWHDRWKMTNGDGEYTIVRQIIPLSEAKREYPFIPEETLREMVRSPELNPFWGGRKGEKYEQAQDRQTLERWTVFHRNAMFERDPEDAIGRGLVEPATDVQQREIEDPASGEIIPGAPEEVPITDEETGEPVYRLLDESGDPQGEAMLVKPGDAAWPKRRGLQQIEMLGDVLLYEGESDFSDIPVARAINYPIADSFYGQGEPQRLAALQEMYNRIWTLLGEYARYFAQPQKAVPVSVMDRMEEEVGQLWSSASQVIGVPDDLIHQFRSIENCIKTLDVPQLQPAFMRMLEIIEREMDTIGGTVMVMRGEAKSEWSGETVKSLQGAARGPIGDKARSVGYALEHIVRVWGNAIIDFLPLDEWANRNRKYPPVVLQAMRDRIKRVGFDVVAEVSGSGPREKRQENLIQLIGASPRLGESPTFLSKMVDEFGIGDAEIIVNEAFAADQQAAPPE